MDKTLHEKSFDANILERKDGICRGAQGAEKNIERDPQNAVIVEVN